MSTLPYLVIFISGISFGLALAGFIHRAMEP